MAKRSYADYKTFQDFYKDTKYAPKLFLITINFKEDAEDYNEKIEKWGTVEKLKSYIIASFDLNENPLKLRYWAFSFERGLKENTLHVHIMLYFGNSESGASYNCSVMKMSKIFPNCHIDFKKVGDANSNLPFVIHDDITSDGNFIPAEKKIHDYVFKLENYETKEETRIEDMCYENIDFARSGLASFKNGQGKRSDLLVISQMLEEGKTPKQILSESFSYYRYENMIKKAYYDKRFRETAIKRNVDVVVHVGVSGSGKSNITTSLDENNMCIFADYSSALFDNYNGESTVVFDEFRGQIAYNQLLLILDGYKVPLHARYSNIYSLWNTVHITSVIPIEEWYHNDNIRDTFVQLKRRVSKIVYHFMTDKNGNIIKDKDAFLFRNDANEIVYHEYEINARQYTNYADLEKKALASINQTTEDVFNLNDGQPIILQKIKS